MSLPFKITMIPNHGFDAISHEIKFLAIEDSFLEVAVLEKCNLVFNR
jgi:hypothetical protein